jgi:hypothetical protein
LVRVVRSLSRKSNLSEQNDSLIGWGWTPRTSSWVEPTSFALLSMQSCGSAEIPPALLRRGNIAVEMLYDRMCPGGGWNCGNPRVYGVDGQPLVLPTAWALMALRSFPDHPRKSKSLAWLEAEFPKIQSPASLAVASICLEAYGKSMPSSIPDLEKFNSGQMENCGIHVVSWICLASNSYRKWPAPLQLGNR